MRNVYTNVRVHTGTHTQCAKYLHNQNILLLKPINHIVNLPNFLMLLSKLCVYLKLKKKHENKVSSKKGLGLGLGLGLSNRPIQQLA